MKKLPENSYAEKLIKNSYRIWRNVNSEDEHVHDAFFQSENKREVHYQAWSYTDYPPIQIHQAQFAGLQLTGKPAKLVEITNNALIISKGAYTYHFARKRNSLEKEFSFSKEANFLATIGKDFYIEGESNLEWTNHYTKIHEVSIEQYKKMYSPLFLWGK